MRRERPNALDGPDGLAIGREPGPIADVDRGREVPRGDVEVHVVTDHPDREELVLPGHDVGDVALVEPAKQPLKNRLCRPTRRRHGDPVRSVIRTDSEGQFDHETYAT